MSSIIHIRPDEENYENNLRNKGSKVTNSRFNQQKRVPLGQISSNTVRINPIKTNKQRGAFVTVNDAENIAQITKCFNNSNKFQPKAQPFQIHVDDEENEIKAEPKRTNLKEAALKLQSSSFYEKLTLHSAITDVPVQERSSEINDDCFLRDSHDYLDVTFEDLDSHETKTCTSIDNVILVKEYSDDIYSYLRSSEKKHDVRSSYMKKQPDITSEMRSILIDWLVEVAEEFELCPETLYLSVAYIDRFLSIMSVLRSKLQLVGTACMFIASKYEEIYPRGVRDFVYITDDTYTEKQVLKMEQLIYKVLSFSLSLPTMHCFLQYYGAVLKIDKPTEYLAAYFCELSMLETEPFLQYYPSKIALSALVLAAHTNELDNFMDVEFEEKSRYVKSDLNDCIQALYKVFVMAPTCKQQAIREKYKSTRYHEVAMTCPRECLP